MPLRAIRDDSLIFGLLHSRRRALSHTNCLTQTGGLRTCLAPRRAPRFVPTPGSPAAGPFSPRTGRSHLWGDKGQR